MKKDSELRSNLLDCFSYGIKIGSLYTNNFPADIKAVLQIIALAKKGNFEVLFIRISSSDPIRENILKEIGAKRFDTLVTFKREFDGLLQETLIISPDVVIELKDHIENKKDLERIQEISSSAFTHNHRSVDERLSRTGTQRLFAEWARKDAEESAQQTIIARVQGLVVGYATLLLHENDEEFKDKKRGLVDLIAVDESYRGKEIGRTLVLSSVEWFSRNAQVATVGTQEDNPAAFLYQKCGFVKYKCEDTYHLWLDSLPK